MRLDVFEEAAPVCPRCLHHANRISPLKIGDRAQERGGDLWHGTLHCSDTTCWLEFPVIDGIPVVVPDPKGFLAGAQGQVLARTDLPPTLSGLLADALGPASDYDTTRQHLSLYAESHYGDWTDEPRREGVAPIVNAGLDLLQEPPSGPAIDLGGSVGRGGWEIAGSIAQTTIVTDLNFAMLRLGKRLLQDGHVDFDLRRVGVVYDRIEAVLPDAYRDARLDFWAADIAALPFRDGQFGLATAVNVLDCVPSAAAVLAECSRILGAGGQALFTTPYDWSATAASMEQWLGGHSQRGPLAGRSEPVLRATLSELGFEISEERDDIEWQLRLHDRSVMHYVVHLLTCRKP